MVRLGAVFLVAIALLAGPATADVNPGDFSVSISSGFPQPSLGAPSCSLPDANGASTCTVSGSVSGIASGLQGTATQISTGRSGNLSASCDWSGNYNATATATLQRQISVSALSGSVTQACSWQVTVGASSLEGTMSGGGSLGLAGSTTASYAGSLSVAVAAGTGEFAGMVGGGTFQQNENVPLPQTFRTRSLASAAADIASSLNLTLTQGKARALIASPGTTLTARNDSGLRVVTAPRAACSAVARSGANKVALGHATDATGSGLVIVVPKLRPKLHRGVWTISVSCSYAGGRAAGSAAVSVR